MATIIEKLGYSFIIYLVYILLISAIAFIFMGFDKVRAKKEGQRIPEKLLLLLAFLGGGIGILIGMVFFHHKINKKKFTIGVPLLYILNKLISSIIIYKYFI